MDIIFRSYSLQLKHEFKISRYSYKEQPTLIIELKDGAFSGYGEATSNKYYGVTISRIKETILLVQDKINFYNGLEPSAFYKAIVPFFIKNTFALCALDMAYNDLYAKKQGEKLYKLWGLTNQDCPKTSYTIALDDIESMVAKLKEKQWPIYKIKLGTPNDIEIVTKLREHTNAVFRVDANCGWTVKETIENASMLYKLGVEFIEQPLKANDWYGHKEVFKHSVLPIIADESCLLEEDVFKCKNHFHGINVKLTKCGGLTPAKRMLENANHIGLKTMVGCMVESSVGISAIAHLLPLLDYVDMDGSLLLKKDIAEGVSIVDGIIAYSKLNGIGVELKEASHY